MPPLSENTPSSGPDTCHRFREPRAFTDYTSGDGSELRRGARRAPRPHYGAAAPWASSSAQNFMGQDEEQRRDILTSTPRMGSATLDACVEAISDPSVTTSHSRARAP